MRQSKFNESKIVGILQEIWLDCLPQRLQTHGGPT
ncbi:MAG: hypothetical protein CNCCGFBP_01896 [Fimbriimonadaceae bacterium]|nr:hypothetical protein [Fimbriimonadaceae bacterium]